MQKTVKIINQTGLHARPASMFVQIASKYKCEIKLQCNGLEGNGKSILSLLGMGIKYGNDLTIITNGEDAQIALDALIEAIEGKFGEI